MTCEDCGRVFGSLAGKQLHRKRKHAESYNASLPEPSSRNIFTTEILRDIATVALEYPGKAACRLGIGQYIAQRFPRYTVDALNALRKRRHYRDIEAQLRAESAGADRQVPGGSGERAGEVTERLPRVGASSARAALTPVDTLRGEDEESESGEGIDRMTMNPMSTRVETTPPHVADRPSGARFAGAPGAPPGPPEEPPTPPGGPGGTPDIDRMHGRRVATRPERLNDIETQAWDFYDKIVAGEDMNTSHDDLMRTLHPEEMRNPRDRPGRHPRDRPVNDRRPRADPAVEPRNRNQRKRERYMLHQRLYHKAPSVLMNELRQPGSSGRSTLPATAEISRVYGERFGSISPPDDHPFTTKADAREVGLDPFSEGEVRQVLKGLGASSAPGPDGVTVPMVVEWGVNVIRPIVNAYLHSGTIPDSLRLNRTTLIPKTAEPEGINDYRPLTIGAMLNRLYAKLLTRRLTSTVQLDTRQKAFVPVDGCSEHLFVVGEAIEQCRKGRRECNLVFLDLAKAFDMVSHASIQRALRRFGVGERFQQIVNDLYTGVRTVIAGNEGPTEPIMMSRGVKQGCPLSPVLFNMTMDELMEDVLGGRHALKPRTELEGFNALAFADDLVLASGTAHGTAWLLARTREFFEQRSMTVNAAKSHVIRMAPAPGTRTLKVVEGTTYTYGGEPLQNRGITDVVKYLGLRLTPIGTPNFKTDGAVKDLYLIRGAALKPAQKLDMIRRILLPAHMHTMRLCRTSDQALRKLDGELRKVARGILHLPPGTPKAFFTLKAKDGGLALPSIRDSVGETRLKRISSLRASKDGLVSSYARASLKLEREMRYWREALDIVDTSTRGLAAHRRARPGKAAAEFRQTQVGSLFDAGASRLGHGWIKQPKSLSGGEYVHAVHMISENMPTRVNINRGRPDGRRNCRRCHGTAETQLHVLNQCRASKDAQIRRHNWVCNSIREKVMEEAPNASVLSEHRVPLAGEEFRPDLIIIRGSAATVVDVAICYDHRAQCLRTRYRDKVRKYEVIKEALKVQLNQVPDERRREAGREMIETVNIEAVVIGSRGLLIPETCQRPLERMGIYSRNYMRYLQEGTIRGSVKVWRAFKA